MIKSERPKCQKITNAEISRSPSLFEGIKEEGRTNILVGASGYFVTSTTQLEILNNFPHEFKLSSLTP